MQQGEFGAGFPRNECSAFCGVSGRSREVGRGEQSLDPVHLVWSSWHGAAVRLWVPGASGELRGGEWRCVVTIRSQRGCRPGVGAGA